MYKFSKFLLIVLLLLFSAQLTFAGRYYDSTTGRWLSVDPLASKYPGWSPYNYTLNNPLNNIDPDGKKVVFSGNLKERKRFNNYISRLVTTTDGKRLFEKLEGSKNIFKFRFGGINNKNTLAKTRLSLSKKRNKLAKSSTTIDEKKINGRSSTNVPVEGTIGHEMQHISEAMDNPNKFIAEKKKEDKKFPGDKNANKRPQEKRANSVGTRITKELYKDKNK